MFQLKCCQCLGLLGNPKRDKTTEIFMPGCNAVLMFSFLTTQKTWKNLKRDLSAGYLYHLSASLLRQFSKSCSFYFFTFTTVFYENKIKAGEIFSTHKQTTEKIG